MIKIFRKIRKDLLNTGKTTKPALPTGRYLKYAIGEIILVVIGILIALQLNNWKKTENASKKEVALLVNIKNDLQADILNLKRQDSLFAKSEKDFDLGITLFYKATTIKDIDAAVDCFYKCERNFQGTYPVFKYPTAPDPFFITASNSVKIKQSKSVF